jgi:hypothetical protein
MFYPVTGPSSHETNIKYAKECSIKTFKQSIVARCLEEFMVLCVDSSHAGHHSIFCLWSYSFFSVWMGQFCINKLVLADQLLFHCLCFYSVQLDLPFVEVHRAREFTFQALSPAVSHPDLLPRRAVPRVSVWNCDGEVQWETDIRIRWDYSNNRLPYTLL